MPYDLHVEARQQQALRLVIRAVGDARRACALHLYATAERILTEAAEQISRWHLDDLVYEQHDEDPRLLKVRRGLTAERFGWIPERQR